MCTIIDFRRENRILVMTISIISMRQNRSISFVSILFLLGEQGVIIYIYIYNGLMTHFHVDTNATRFVRSRARPVHACAGVVSSLLMYTNTYYTYTYIYIYYIYDNGKMFCNTLCCEPLKIHMPGAFVFHDRIRTLPNSRKTKYRVVLLSRSM